MRQRVPIVLAGLVVLAALAAGGCADQPLTPQSQKIFAAGHEAYDAGKYQQAEQNFSDVIAKNPNSWALPEVYYFRGLTRLKLGQRDGARSDFHWGATHYGRELAQVYSALALANMEYEDGNDATAARMYEKILEHPVKDLPIDGVLFRLGNSYQRLGQWAKADETFARLISEYPNSPFIEDGRRHFQASYFTVQVGAYGDRRNADALAEKLRKQGYTVTVLVAASGGKTLHTVNVGQYRTRADAVKVAEKLRTQGYATIIKP